MAVIHLGSFHAHAVGLDGKNHRSLGLVAVATELLLHRRLDVEPESSDVGGAHA